MPTRRNEEDNQAIIDAINKANTPTVRNIANDATSLINQAKIKNATGVVAPIKYGGEPLVFPDRTQSTTTPSATTPNGTNSYEDIWAALQERLSGAGNIPTFNAGYKSSNTAALEAQAKANLGNKPTWDAAKMSEPMMQALAKYQGRDPFSYNINADALYEQYKNQYTREGKLAMEDAIGKASQMTGGYGNSYAEQVGQQTYQGYLGQLNDRVPELYQLAYGKYQDEGNDLYKQYALQRDLYDLGYGEYRNNLSDFYTEQNRLDSLAQQAAEMDYKNSVQQYNAQMDKYNAEQTARQNAYDMALSLMGGTGDTTGTSSGTAKTLSASDSTKISEQLDKISDLNSLESYINLLATNGTIDEETAKSMFIKYSNKLGYDIDEATGDTKQRPTEENTSWIDRSYTLVDNGGNNYGGHVDNNAVVQDQFGNVLRLDELVERLQENGMSKSAAKKWVESKQKEWGATKK